jgi:hypothetical protein
MVSKCANPECSAPFRYLRFGKLFRVEMQRDPSVSQALEPMFAPQKSARRAHFFWLCDGCSSKVKLVLGKNGIAMEPLVRTRAASAGS